MIASGAGPAVVACTRSNSKRGSSMASTAVTTIGMYSGLQPAITALIAIFSIAIAAAEAAVGLALVIAVYRHNRTTNVDHLDQLKG